MSFKETLTSSAFRAIPLRPLQKVDASRRDPVATQVRLLTQLLERASDTEWGRRFGFAEMLKAPNPVSAYQERMPLHEYEAYREDVDRIRRGEADIIWPGTFKDFAVSSGTASAGKIIPVSGEMLRKNRSFSVGVGLNYLRELGNIDFLLGKHLTLPGRIEEDPKYPGTKIGEVSGLQAEYAPRFFRLLYQAVPNEVAFLPNWERKLRAIAERTVDMDVRSLVMAPTWALVFFRALLERYNERQGRAARHVVDVWPNLQVFISGGVALSSYKDLLAETIGRPDLHFLETYGASEGFFSFQDGLADPSMLLHLDNGVFFEFVRMQDLGNPAARRYTIREVEEDVRYALFVTTCSGLWSYGVGDVVRFTSTRPHRILVAGRTSEMIDRYGEAVFGEEARSAMQEACTRTGARVRDYHISPSPAAVDRLPAHQWLIEFDQPPESPEAFSRAVDEYLCKVNRHYQIRREAGAFASPEIVVLSEGTFYEWLVATKGRVSGQTKVPRLSEERVIADGVLNVLRSRPATEPG